MTKLLIYSDLHLEFYSPILETSLFEEFYKLPVGEVDADILVLAGDIGLIENPKTFADIINAWGDKPVIIVTGNHEYYRLTNDFQKHNEYLREFLNNQTNNQNIHILDLNNFTVKIGDINFIGDTAWTDLKENDNDVINTAQSRMADYRYIEGLEPKLTSKHHNDFKDVLIKALDTSSGINVVVTHHSPAVLDKSKYLQDEMTWSFCSTKMGDIIKTYQPDLWIYGHTHENCDYNIGKTRIVSNQRGYPRGSVFECEDFNPKFVVELGDGPVAQLDRAADF